jgi:DNA-binding response OmpR family regulator
MDVKGKILVVDDDLNILEMIRQLLAKSGYEVQTATNTIGAGYLLGDFQPDLVVLDIMLPGSLSGDQACDTLRQFRPGIKIVFHSGIDETKLYELADRHKADGVVAKGSRPTELLRKIAALLGTGESESS